jgi:hypothetical protein
VRTRGWTLQQVAVAVKRSIAHVSKRVRLFEDPLLRTAVAERGLPLSTAEELLAADPVERDIAQPPAAPARDTPATRRHPIHAAVPIACGARQPAGRKPTRRRPLELTQQPADRFAAT